MCIDDTVQSAIEARSDKSAPTGKSNYYYVDQRKYGIVWRNVILFALLHCVYLYGFYAMFTYKRWNTWFFRECAGSCSCCAAFIVIIDCADYFYGYFGGLGVTAGAHRLFSHKSYKASIKLRWFLCICHCIAGQVVELDDFREIPVLIA